MLPAAAAGGRDFHLSDEHICAVGGGDVIQQPGHRVAIGLGRHLARFGVGAIDSLVVSHFSRLRVEGIEADSTVEVRRPPGCEPAFPIVHEHAAWYGPRRLQLTEGSYETMMRRSVKTPYKCSVRGTEAMDPPVGRAEYRQSFMHCGR